MLVVKKIIKLFKIIKNKTWCRGLFKNIAASIELENLVKNLNINTFFDIGSNKGQFILLVEGLFKNKKIYSVEPIKELYLKQKNFFIKIKEFHSLIMGLVQKVKIKFYL